MRYRCRYGNRGGRWGRSRWADRGWLRGRGIVGVTFTDDGQGNQRVTRSPEDVEVVVAGGKGGHSAVILPWSLHADPIHELVRLPDGQPARGIEAFRRAQTQA